MEGIEHEITAESGSRENASSAASEAKPNGNAGDGELLARAAKWLKKELQLPDDQLSCIGALIARATQVLNAQQNAIEHGIENCNTTLLEEPAVQRGIAAYSGLLRQWISLMKFYERLKKEQTEGQMDPLRRTAR